MPHCLAKPVPSRASADTAEQSSFISHSPLSGCHCRYFNITSFTATHERGETRDNTETSLVHVSGMIELDLIRGYLMDNYKQRGMV